MWVLYILVALCYMAVPATSVEVVDCGNKNSLLRLKSISIEPETLKIPGKVQLAIEVEVTRDVDEGALLYVDLGISRRLPFGFFVGIPCLRGVGSCEYDLCPLLDESFTDGNGCIREMADNNIPCTCGTIKAGTYSIPKQEFTIPNIPAGLSFLAQGTYKSNIKLLDRRQNGKEVSCVDIQATIDN